MVAGHICEKSGYLYVVLQLRDRDGNRKQQWIATHLKTKGNKRRAEEMLQEFRREYTAKEAMKDRSKAVFFDAYLTEWLERKRGNLSPNTFGSYQNYLNSSICPYFREKNILLADLKPAEIQDYYNFLYSKGLSGNTALHHHIVIHQALDEAVMRELIPANPANRVKRPKKEQYVANCYSVEECNQLLKCIKGEKLELVISLTLFYGLRRSEVLGLKWRAIDFNRGTLSITHSVNLAPVDGHYEVFKQDKVKRKSSFRTLPLIDPLTETLKKEVQHRFGDATPPADAYVCVDEKGELFKPNYLSQGFDKLLKRHNLRKIRFHDLRHSCANLLIASRVPLIEVQQWLGHSSVATTADLYSHLSYETKFASADTLKKT
jgi:Site-specific recombinase XerD